MKKQVTTSIRSQSRAHSPSSACPHVCFVHHKSASTCGKSCPSGLLSPRPLSATRHHGVETPTRLTRIASRSPHSFSFSWSHLVAISTPSSIFSGWVPWPCREGSLPPERPPTTSDTDAAHCSAVTPWEERCYMTGLVSFSRCMDSRPEQGRGGRGSLPFRHRRRARARPRLCSRQTCTASSPCPWPGSASSPR